MQPDEVVELLNRYRGELAETMGVRFTSSDPNLMTAEMPVDGNRQPFGLLHGGASAVLAETLGSITANMLAPEGMVAVGIELSCTHHRSATSGLVRATAKPIHIGRTLATIEIRIVDTQDRPVATSRLTCIYREPPKGIKDPRKDNGKSLD